MTKLGGADDRFGNHLCVYWANLTCLSGCNQLANTKFTTPVTKISKSNDDFVSWLKTQVP